MYAGVPSTVPVRVSRPSASADRSCTSPKSSSFATSGCPRAARLGGTTTPPGRPPPSPRRRPPEGTPDRKDVTGRGRGRRIIPRLIQTHSQGPAQLLARAPFARLGGGTMSSVDTQTYTHDCYLAYKHQDKEWVSTELVPVLERENFRLLEQDLEYSEGAQLLDEMERNVARTRRTLVILSRDWKEPQWDHLERLFKR